MKTLIFIDGGMSFATYDEYLTWLKRDYTEWCKDTWSPEPRKKWKHKIASQWIDTGGVVYIPEMPCDLDAKYIEWKIIFESVIGRLSAGDTLTLIGHSLGGNFLLKYFTEDLAKTDLTSIQEVYLVAACISEGDFTTPENYEALRVLGDRVHIWHAEDDSVVPFSVGGELASHLPEAQTHFFSSEKGYGHFHGLERIPELEEVIFRK